MLRLSGLSPTEVGAATVLGWGFEGREMVTLGVEWLCDGWDTPTLRELAGASLGDEDLRGLWAATLAELEVDRPERLAACHLLARWCVRKWEQEPVPEVDLIGRLRDLLTHGAYTRGREGNAWPGERTLRALAHVGCRLEHAGDNPAPSLSADELRLLDQVRYAVDGCLQGAAFTADCSAPFADGALLVDRDETIRRLVAVAPGFAWDDTDLDDSECLGGPEHGTALVGWIAREATRRPAPQVVEAMAIEIEFLLSGGGPASRMRAAEFLAELSGAVARRRLDLDAIAATLGPVARRVWSEVAPSEF